MLSRRDTFGLFLLGLAGPAAAQPAPALSDEDQAVVQRAVAYLESLTTARGRFSQSAARGAVSTGTFWLQRPGRARFDYDPPSGLVVASNGAKFSVVDRRLKTVQSYPLAATPLALFLARDIRLDRGVAVTQVIQSGDSFTIVARDAHHRNAGQIALRFAARPLALAGWTLTDQAGGTVRVALEDFAPSAPKERSFFTIDTPGRLGG
jgi:outer membrane lipoprotein-sorting protein